MVESNVVKSWSIIGLILISLFAVSNISYSPPFSILNEGELGSSEFKNSLIDSNFNISRIVYSPIILTADDSVEMVIIVGSERKYTQAEISAYNQFVENGGILVVFEDFGPARAIPENFGIEYFPGTLKESFEPLMVNRPSQFFIQDLLFTALIQDEDFYFPPLLVSEAAAMIDPIGFLRGETIPLLASFPSSFVDTNNNNAIDGVDIVSPLGFPLGLMKFFIGEQNGTLITFGDSSMGLNRYWERTVSFDGTPYALPNALWISLFIGTMARAFGVDRILFDESHLEPSFTSATGILNLLLGTYVGLINTIGVTATLVFITIGFSSNRFRKRFDKVKDFSRRRDKNLILNTGEAFISNPTLSEKLISEQYILYQIMGDNFIHTANSDVINKLRKMGKSEYFLEALERKYGGSLNRAMKADKLMELHMDLREYVDKNTSKWI